MSSSAKQQPYYLSRTDVIHPLASCSKIGFELDGAVWPSAEHYYQGMKFEDQALREEIRTADHPTKAQTLAAKNKRSIRKDWKQLQKVMMTRAIYIKCRANPDVVAALLATGEQEIIETSQYDYYWGCGRDGRGHNTFGKVLMAVRNKLREEQLTE
ncbi:MAG: NADAR family protein [Candidatus Thiodiazotropha lotti]|uniref:NADAR family protein n=1 Tax=Candidatus Thiodiazotropha lotti TaxID=2792787 RepID=A0A9E4K560_9GAMM|nr:NADAR family protein [Candidatus Thiodiazotropha lotti]ODB99549.1 GTP cyclohydrolase [Candidatus Thiodiazotropha endoloripes]MCG7923380.1 NADAR family protein [Candidatus Thiodiazotropha lotti]MCG7931781.1 NADAR family protein [Candidatus Thiodiazotropha lotti]MCG7938880.1 NADAR family protein [Candidatus Thiodiazotropha lotti]